MRRTGAPPPSRPGRRRPGLHIPPEQLPLLAAGITPRPRYRVADPATGQLVERTPQVRHVPAATASTRLLSVQAIDRHARKLARQARHAHGYSSEWLALLGRTIHHQQVDGATRADSRQHMMLVAAAIAACADWTTGRHSMPGRPILAAMTGLSERTITRACARLVKAGFLELETPGRWLTAAERAEIEADPEQRNRWRDRAGWRLVTPRWSLQGVRDVDLAAWMPYARAALAAVADPDATVELRPPAVIERTVSPPSGGYLGRYLPVVRTRFSQLAALRRRRQRRRGPAKSRPTGRAESAAPRRLASTEGARRPRRGRRMPAEAVVLARQLAADSRFPWLRDAPRPMVAAAVSRLALAGWTVEDLVEQANGTVAARGWTVPQWVVAPVAYLALLLRDADPAQPPVTTRRRVERERGELLRAQQAAQRAQRAERASRALSPAELTRRISELKAQLRR